MQSTQPQPGRDLPELPPDEPAPQKTEPSEPMHDDGLGKPQRQPGQIDVAAPPGEDATKDA